MTAVETEKTSRAGDALPPVDRGPLRRRRRVRSLQQLAAVAITLFMGVPVYLIALAALSSRTALNDFPKSFLPTGLSTTTIRAFLSSTGIGPATFNSVASGLLTVLLALVIGAPAGYALARYVFRGRDAYQLVLLLTRALPIVVLSIPLAQLFLNTGVYDTVTAVVLIHTALALPTTVLITASIFVSVPRDVEEAALIFGCTRFGAFRRVVLPLAVPGLAASSVFTFVLSWNEVLGAAVITLDHRTLPAQVLTSLQQSPLAYRFAGGFLLVIPALVFIALMRRYLLNMWGTRAG
ncbi:carbohydrate ABC transporter permease [Streptomyces antimycoticus]|uniref:Sugar ABC transporter permease n=1 Tax=Streptomyces antimycoticus TaxID=68175 RepID=A0A4D4JYU8_9ACTN|nr:carbohydrate ABC transporter permease [Streptomyces antimycoticus]BBJ46409.1 sugar ABC transporter permease [Streptomyces antimycoticus]GDY40020.1 sugar ABC transporter permease [Streptomyces antimycoticus]